VIWPDSFLYEHERQRRLFMSLEKNFVFFITVVRSGGGSEHLQDFAH
jgi:hypothetical protein